jgi:hypothetical protein
VSAGKKYRIVVNVDDLLYTELGENVELNYVNKTDNTLSRWKKGIACNGT